MKHKKRRLDIVYQTKNRDEIMNENEKGAISAPNPESRHKDNHFSEKIITLENNYEPNYRGINHIFWNELYPIDKSVLAMQ